VASLLGLSLTACSNHVSNESNRRVEIIPAEPVEVEVTCAVPCDTHNDALAHVVLREATSRWNNTVLWNAVVAKSVEAAKQPVRADQGVKQRPTAAVSAPSGLRGVIQCIKDHESGDYLESSHIRDGSGAYQVIPSTWRHWSARAGHGGYSYAYKAPPAVQDAVVVYMLTNGGAGNWSPRFGNNPCTVGMGG
jgi:hypothetical protein